MIRSVFGKEAAETPETAIVVERDGNSTHVQLNINPACNTCGASGFCHPASGLKPKIEINNDIGATVGDVVQLETAASSRLIAAFILFGIPLLMILLGALLGNSMENSSQDSVVAGSIAGLALSLLLVNRINRWFRNRLKFKPRAVRILSSQT